MTFPCFTIKPKILQRTLNNRRLTLLNDRFQCVSIEATTYQHCDENRSDRTVHHTAIHIDLPQRNWLGRRILVRDHHTKSHLEN